MFFFLDGIVAPLTDDDGDANLTPATINPRDTLKITLNVTKHDSSIAWRFRSHNHDIGFQLVYQDGKVILPFSRVQSQKQLQEGSHPCSQLGTYTVIFDNTYSLARTKTVYYNVSVIEPEEMNSNYMDDNSNTNSSSAEIISTEPPTQKITSSTSVAAIATAW